MRVLVALTLPEANQAIEALRNRADSMRHRVTLGKARIEDVAASILDCAMAEAAIREAFGFDVDPDDVAAARNDAEWVEAVATCSYDPSEGESHDPLPDIPLAAVTADPGDTFFYPMGVGR